MVKNFDHLTVVVRDVEAARRFFSLLGFEKDKSVVISGPVFSAYMAIEDIETEHVTLALAGASPRTEVQLLRYRHPEALPDPAITKLNKLGFNHVCFAVDDLEAEVARLTANGVKPQRGARLPQPQARVSRRPGRHHHRTRPMGLTEHGQHISAFTVCQPEE